MDRNHWFQQFLRNQLQTLALLAFVVGYLALLGWLVWGSSGLWLVALAFVVLAGSSVSPQQVMRWHRAQPLSPHQAPQLYHLLQQLAQRAHLPRVPDLYYLPDRQANAFAVGSPDRSAIAVSDGLIRLLSHDEWAGVLAHELSHIQQRDLQVLRLSDLANRFTQILSSMTMLMIVISMPMLLFSNASLNLGVVLLVMGAPLLSSLAHLAISRVREYAADLNAARLTGDPQGLASALVKLEGAQQRWWTIFRLPRPAELGLLRTHPPLQQRIDRLMALLPEGARRYRTRPMKPSHLFQSQRPWWLS
jgi:heat shock protein HtpX